MQLGVQEQDSATVCGRMTTLMSPRKYHFRVRKAKESEYCREQGKGYGKGKDVWILGAQNFNRPNQETKNTKKIQKTGKVACGWQSTGLSAP